MVEDSGDPKAGLPTASDEFDVGENWVGRIVVLGVSGAVDMLTAPQLTDAIQAAQRQEPSGLIIDLSKVDFLASAGMSALVVAHEQINSAIRFGVVADGPATSRPIKLVGIAEILNLYATLDDALTDFSDETSAGS